jgi:hypothetical protein
VASTPYIGLTAFRAATLMPGVVVDELEAKAPGWIDGELTRVSRGIDSRLAKRYDVPFDTTNPPEAVVRWLVAIVTVRAYVKQGVNPDDPQFILYKEDRDAAVAEVAEAADSDTGKFELPQRSTESATAIARGGPYGYSETSPYVAFDLQADTGMDEDANRSGSDV